MKYLVKFEKDWADELDVYGFAVFDSLEDFDLLFDEISEEGFYFGTNQGWDEDELDKDTDFKITEISNETADVLLNHFGRFYGIFPV